jgi:hypothetical protein
MRSQSKAWACALLAALCACASVSADPWNRASVIFQDGDVVARIDSRRSASGVTLAWIGVRSDGDRRLRSVRVIVFDDVNGDSEPQSEEQLTRWNTGSPEPQREFWVKASFAAQNMKPDVLARLMVFTEVGYDGAEIKRVSETRALP